MPSKIAGLWVVTKTCLSYFFAKRTNSLINLVQSFGFRETSILSIAKIFGVSPEKPLRQYKIKQIKNLHLHCDFRRH